MENKKGRLACKCIISGRDKATASPPPLDFTCQMNPCSPHEHEEDDGGCHESSSTGRRQHSKHGKYCQSNREEREGGRQGRRGGEETQEVALGTTQKESHIHTVSGCSHIRDFCWCITGYQHTKDAFTMHVQKPETGHYSNRDTSLIRTPH